MPAGLIYSVRPANSDRKTGFERKAYERQQGRLRSVKKPLDSLLTAIHDAVMALPPDERCDRAKVNEAVRDGFKLGPPRSAGTDDR